MPNRLRRVAALWFCVALFAFAANSQQPAKQAKREFGAWGGSVGSEPPSPQGFRIDWAEQDRLAAADPAAAAWIDAHFGWRIVFDPATRLPWRAFGPGLAIASRGAGEAEIREAASRFAVDLHAELRLPGDPPAVRFAAFAGGLWYVSFDQRQDGVRVDDAGLALRIDAAGRLVMWGGRFLPVSGLRKDGVVRAEDARLLAVAALRAEGFLGVSSRLAFGDTTEVIHAPLGGDGTRPGAAWKVRLSVDQPLAEWILYIDASTGAVRESWNDVRFLHHETPRHLRPRGRREGGPSLPPARSEGPAVFTAAVTGLVHENVDPDQPPVFMPFPDSTFTIVDGASPPVNATSDASGNFSFTGGPASSATVASGLDGVWITTNNSTAGGPQAAFSATVAAGAPSLAAVFDDTNSLLAERDAFFFGTRARNNILLHNPTETLFNGALPANVNLAQTCNAFYNGSSINFFAAGGGCINTAYSDTVVEHEYGHHVSNVIYNAHGRSVPGHLGEGYSDLQAASCEDTNLIGYGFFGPGTLIRDLNNTCQWPASCGTGVHARGCVIGGSVWHTRVEFAAAFGAAGKVQLDQYLYAHLHGAPLNETEAFLELLLLDDDDANVLNGTPNFLKFLQGFTTLHGVPCPIPTAIVSHFPLGATANQLHDYQIRATAVQGLGGVIAAGSVVYTVNGGATVVLPMTSAGSEWSAAIPVVAGPAVVEYYLVFVDAGGAATFDPATAPAVRYAFRNFRPEVFFSDGFESASGWVTAGVGQNDWHRQAPGNPNHAYDPATAYAGVACFGNDLSPPGSNGNYRANVDNSLTSPVVDCSTKTGVFLDYRRWLTVEDALYDQARIEISVGGGPFVQVWQNAATAGGIDHHLDTTWVRHQVRLPQADGQASVRIRFRLTSDGGAEFGGWTVDELKLDAVPASPILTATGPLVAGSTLTFGVGGQTGDLFVLAADVGTPGVFVPGLGTIAVDPSAPSFLLLVPPGAATLPTTGRYLLPLTVPPGIAGFTVYGEAVVLPADGSPFVISNVTTTTFL